MAAKRKGPPLASTKRMIDTMIELAFRGKDQESLVKRIAKAGGITEVITHINRMQKHVKNMTKSARDTAEGAGPRMVHRAKKRTSARRNTGNTGAGAGSSEAGSGAGQAGSIA